MPQSFRPDTIELELFGGARTVHVDVPQGESTLTDLLPAARALADAVSNAGVEDAAKRQRKVSCCAGCAACCRQVVGISAVEAMGLARTVAAMPPERRAVIEQRFAKAVEKLEEAGLLDRNAPWGQRRILGMEPGKTTESGKAASARYFAQQIACPFLENESCSIYAERPLMCREYNVTSPRELCSDFRNAGIKKVSLPLYAGGPLVRVAAQVTGLEVTAMPLTLALEWAAANAQPMSAEQDGGTLYDTWLASMGASQEAPL